MPEAIENYVSQDAAGQIRRRAFFVWSAFALLAAVWVFLIALAPLAEAVELPGVADPLYKFFGYLCHQMAERSFQIGGHAFAVCSRCFGIYCGLLLGFVIYPLLRPIGEVQPLPKFWLFLAMIPMAIDWSAGFFEVWANTHWSRFATGLILGAACAVFIIPALIEISTNLSRRGNVKRLSV